LAGYLGYPLYSGDLAAAAQLAVKAEAKMFLMQTGCIVPKGVAVSKG
jgi:hypothetical protein